MESILMTAENFSQMNEELEKQLERLKVEPRDILNTELLVEEIFWLMINRRNAKQVKVRVVKNFFGKVQVRMTAADSPTFSAVNISEWSEDEDYYRLLILKANRQRINWFREKNFSVVIINVRDESNRLMKLTLVSMAGGLVCGVLMNLILSPEIISFIEKDIMTPINTMFLHALNMVIAPVIFFSIISGVKGMGEGANLGKVGSKLIGLYVSTMGIAAAITLMLSMIFFQSGAPQVAKIAADNVTGQPYEFSLVKFVVDIIPNNLVSPIVDGNLLQVIFIAVLSGICLNALGEKVKLLEELIDNCNELFMKMVGMIISFMPLIVFSAMMSMALDTNTELLLEISKLVFLQLVCLILMLGVYMLMILFLGKITPLPFLKKIPSMWTVPFATSSSSVSMPITMKLCTEKLGISPKISSFAIPIGTTVNMNGACIGLSSMSIMFLKMYGVEVDLNTLAAILAMTVSLSVGMPAVPNAGVICILTIVGTFGVPNDITGLVFCIGALCDRPITCFNVTGDVAAAFVLARTENLTDEKIYLGN